uniref:Methyltransferase type 11 domain-containing protein n=1 Tax=Octopus bimaculoides TaxID=37653 RepID=A0A0L8G8V8_OCTBM
MLEQKAAEEYIKAVGNDDKNAYSRNLNAHHKGISREEMTESYSDWITNGNYEEDLGPNRYRGPVYASQALANLYEDNVRASTRILDVAAGSGLLGEKKENRVRFGEDLDAISCTSNNCEIAPLEMA